MADQSNIQSAASKSIRPFKSSEEYLYAMKEDLAEWLNTLYDLDLSADTFADGLDGGCALCRHANNVNRAALDFQRERPEAARPLRMPSKDVVFQSRNVVSGSFVARDNVSNFITWCRQELWIKDVLMFETNDLVERCNEKNFVLCLLEVARRGAKFGMLAPMLIQLEEEIEEEIRDQEIRAHPREPEEAGDPGQQSPPARRYSQKEVPKSLSLEDETDEAQFVWQQKRVLLDMRNLDELVREILGRCSCPGQFPMTKVSEGKYKVGDSSALIFIRVLRTHVMVRVGGGWDTLEHYLDKHDPCRCAAFAHRYHQAKASNQGQGGHSKSSSAHSSRSTSPGPHWRSDAPHKTPDRRTLETPSASCSSGRQGRSHPALIAPGNEPDPGAGRPLLPRPPRDRSEPRQFNPLRNRETMLPLTRRLSGDSDSSTTSSKGGGGGCGGGARRSLTNSSRRSGDEVVLLVNRKEGKHVIERPGGGAASAPGQRRPMPRARSQSRERPAPTSILKPIPPPGPSDGPRNPRTERGRSLANEVPRRLQAARSQSQGKLPTHSRMSDASPGPHYRDPQPPLSERREARQVPPSTPRIVGGFAKRQSSSCSNSPVKGLQSSSSSSPNKKTTVTPRPPAPRSPSMGRTRLLPPVTSGGRRSPHPSPRHSHHHNPPRSPRSGLVPDTAGRGPPPHRGWSGAEEVEEDGPGFGIQMLPALDPQKEQDLYRSFEAEFLANTQRGRGAPSRGSNGVPVPKQPQRGAGALSVPAAADPNVPDSAYSSSNSSTSSLNVGAKMGALPDLRESKRPIPHHLHLEELSGPPHRQTPGGLQNGRQGELERWGEREGTLKKLPAISGSVEEREAMPSSLAGLGDTEPTTSPNQIPPLPTFNCRKLNGDSGGCPSGEVLSDHQGPPRWGSGPEGDIPLPEQQPNLPYDMEDGEQEHQGLPGPEECPSPVALPTSEDCSYQDSSSENSSMCFSLSESHSESSPPPSALTNGNTDGGVVLRPKKGQKKSDRVPSIYKLKLRTRIRPRTDNRPDNSPSRIPTPVSYRDLQTQRALTPHSTPPGSPQIARSNGRSLSHKANMNDPHSHSSNQQFPFPAQPGAVDAEAWM
ncbi:unnamed protein product [Arctogadus glacialis]